jgi:hypothetical protein
MEEPWRRDTPDPVEARDRANFPDHDLRGVGHEDEQGHEGDCPYPCPICMGVGMLRQLNPEIGEHLATAAKEFMLAAKAFLDSVAEGGSKKESEPVERIPFD